MLFWTITDYVRVGDADGVIKRLDGGDSIEERRSSNYTPLINAAYYNQCEMIDLLLDKGADIEAVDKSGLSALRTAIYYQKGEAAILLANRGADANKIAFSQRTALHAAAKDGQLEVVRALLLNGADPTITSVWTGRTAIDYASGDNAEELKTLLMGFVSLEAAIETENAGAIGVLLNKTISEHDAADDALLAYKTVTDSVGIATGEWQTELVKVVEQFEVDMLYRAANSGSTAFVDAILKAISKLEWNLSVPLNAKGWKVLHVATSQGHVGLVHHLLTNYDCDSAALDSEGNKASDLVSGKEDDNSKHIHWLLIQHEKKTKFMQLSSQLLLQDEATTVDIHELPRFMTSIYDLRTLYCLACGILTTDEIKTLLENAFAVAVQEKLMFDDHAALFFKRVLRECLQRELISKGRKDFWKIQARHVNTENADWVREIQTSLVRLEHRATVSERNILSLSQNYSMLRNALETKIRVDEERLRRRQLIGLVTGSLFICGGSLMDGAFNYAFDVCDTAEAIVMELKEACETAEEIVADLTGLKTEDIEGVSKEVLKYRLEEILEQACIDQTQFKNLLQEAITLEKADTSELVAIHRGNGTETIAIGEFLPEVPAQPKFRFRDVVLKAQKLDKESLRQTEILMLVDHSHLTEADLGAHAYHHAVFHSFGDLSEFKERVKYLSPDEADVDATMEIRVPDNTGSITPGNQGLVETTPICWKTIHATAATYASYMGYIDIVEWFLQIGRVSKREEFAQKKEQSYIMINRARSVNKRIQASTAA